MSNSLRQIIVAEDVRILVILTTRAKGKQEIIFLKLIKQIVPSLAVIQRQHFITRVEKHFLNLWKKAVLKRAGRYILQ